MLTKILNENDMQKYNTLITIKNIIIKVIGIKDPQRKLKILKTQIV